MIRITTIFACILLFLSFNARAQQKKDTTDFIFIARVIDSATDKPIDYATLRLKSTREYAAITDKAGYSSIPVRWAPTLQVEIRAISYKIYTDSVHLERSSSGKEYVFRLAVLPSTLQEARVDARSVQQSVDKTVHTVNASDIKASTNVLDLLTRVPFLFVTNQGNVLLNGRSAVQLLVDGKPIADYQLLAAMPPALIKRIEINSNPASRQDADVVGGIVNIITRKDWRGFYGNVMVGGGTNNNVVGSSLVSYKSRKTEINLTAGTNYNKRPFESVIDRKDQLQSTTWMQKKVTTNSGLNPYVNLGFRYAPDSLSAITLFSNYYRPVFKNKGTTDYYSAPLRPGSSLNQDYTLASDITDRNEGIKNYLDYTRKLGRKSEIGFSGQYYVYQSHLSINNTINDHSTDQLQQLQNNTMLKEWTTQADVKYRERKRWTADGGLKWINRRNTSCYETDTFSSSQNIIAGYVAGTYKFSSKWSADGGGRLEWTNDRIHFAQNAPAVKRDYLNLLPGLNIQYSMSDKQVFRLQSSQKIRRPGIYYLNPFLDKRDPRNISSGNPALLPEKYNAFEMSYSWYPKNDVYRITGYYNYNRNLIKNITTPLLDDTSLIKYYNIGKSTDLGLQLYWMINAVKKLRVSGSVTYELNSIHNGNDKSTGHLFALNVNGSYLFPKDISLRAQIQYNSKPVTIQGYNPSITSTLLSLRKRFPQKRCYVSLEASDFLVDNSNRVYYISTPAFTQTTRTNLHIGFYSIRFGLDLGKIKFRTDTDTRINNVDLKSN